MERTLKEILSDYCELASRDALPDEYKIEGVIKFDRNYKLSEEEQALGDRVLGYLFNNVSEVGCFNNSAQFLKSSRFGNSLMAMVNNKYYELVKDGIEHDRLHTVFGNLGPNRDEIIIPMSNKHFLDRKEDTEKFMKALFDYDKDYFSELFNKSCQRIEDTVEKIKEYSGEKEELNIVNDWTYEYIGFIRSALDYCPSLLRTADLERIEKDLKDVSQLKTKDAEEFSKSPLSREMYSTIEKELIDRKEVGVEKL